MIWVLQELQIKNFALVDELAIQFGPGLTVLTGETGAGKSIIIDALNAVLGQRVGAETIREGSDQALLEAVFTAEATPEAFRKLEQAGINQEDEQVIIFRRCIGSERSRYWLNGQSTTLSLLKDIGRDLVDIHGQHEHQSLLYEENHLRFLDAFGGRKHTAAVAEYGQIYHCFCDTRRALENLRANQRERAQRVDMLRFQVAEIEQAGLETDEAAQLEAERKRLRHSEQLQQTVVEGIQALDGEISGGGAQQAAAATAHNLQEASQFDAELKPIAEQIEVAAITLQEALRELYSYQECLEFDPQRLEQIETRLNEIRMLQRKYGDTVAEVLAFGQQAREKLAELENAEQREDELVEEVEKLRQEAGQQAAELSHIRQKLSKRLEKAVTAEVRKLGMAEARFEVELDHQTDPDGLPGLNGQRYAAGEMGIDQVRFLLSANPGEPLAALSRVASGGELSRIMLALKSVCVRGVEIPTLVFDEIDVGIGGVTAHTVAQRLVAASQQAQVLCVTHLPQIARLADQQVYVKKQTVGGRTVIRTQQLSDQERINDLARMFGADRDEQTAYQHAQELLDEAGQEREKIRAAQS